MLALQAIHVAFDATDVLRGISLDVPEGEILCLLGPSGCGKTSLLRIIAGLQAPDEGRVHLAGQVITHQPTHQRKLGFQFQDFALFPHMSVADNVAFGLRRQGWPRAQRQARVGEVLDLVGLGHMGARSIAGLSGGEQQRVALARSLAPRPRLLMLDEPLGSLDAALRDRLAVELREIIKAAGLTALYVTHDQQEAFAIADRVAVMNAGNFEQIASPRELYLQPRTVFVARFLSLHNILSVKHYADGAAHTALGIFPLAEEAPYLLLHPAAMAPGEGPDDALTLSGEVTQCIFRGHYDQITLQHASGTNLLFYKPANSEIDLQPGVECAVHIRPDGIRPLGDALS
ncbi:MAG: ABC transporter ATP-binding protein [Anaerolineales bacterium]